MIRPPGFRGAAFGEAAAGDLRVDEAGRRRAADELGVSPEWAFATQVHGTTVIRATTPGLLGEADAIFTTRQALPIAIATADCVPIILEGTGFTAVIHAGWRGASAGVVERTISELRSGGLNVSRAAIGPSIGPCCYEVGDEVAERFPDFSRRTTWGTTSVDIAGSIEESLGSVPVWRSARCTFTDTELHSYRKSRTKLRQVTVAWLPAL
ncbi:MAG: laccase domain-containing protein [bacterium]|nr:laccase domain-containing protein [bacterium]